MGAILRDGWMVGDAVPEPAEGLFWHPAPGGRVLMPARVVVSQAFPDRYGAPGRCKLTRAAVASYARSRWGPAAKATPWAPTAASFEPVRPAVEALLGHGFWERLEVIGSLVHLAVIRRDAAVTTDLVVRFADGGLGLMAVWSGPDERLHPMAPWAELGAAVAALSDAGFSLSKAVVIWSGAAGVRLEARPVDDALGAWLDAVDLERCLRKHQASGNYRVVVPVTTATGGPQQPREGR